jgi:hypothetical protein
VLSRDRILSRGERTHFAFAAIALRHSRCVVVGTKRGATAAIDYRRL